MAGDHRLHFDRDWRHAELIDGWTVVNVRCRHCIGCNRAAARDWSVRAFHEAQLHTEDWWDPDARITTTIPNSSVVTLTYNDDHLPEDGCLRHDDFQRFMKRLRIRRKRRGDKRPIRYLMCGEFGGKTSRPHYHAILFGECFKERYSEQSLDGQVNQMSAELDELWSQKSLNGDSITNIGRATIDDFSFAGAAYVAGYVAKKTSTAGHQGPIEETTEHGVTRWTPKTPEYRKSSTRPGLGGDWILKPENLAYVYSMDCVKISEWTFHPPKYYDVLLNRHRPELVEDILINRRLGMSEYSREWTPQRCAAAERIALDELQQRRDSL